ncbi:MAG: hypothetical protein H6836_03185 [Planctomycetes bacterium]|nr:hypothetical protein [Planctomycetota bacterium]MCB9888556.1 hypothetical protein [Planctomycetota bacterium]
MTDTASVSLPFWEALREQRWDDHRYYHQCRVNQSLHLISACCFLSSYVMIFVNPIYAAMVGWLGAMLIRQVGHFFFEPKAYDHVNRATHEYKESVKVGYNLRRKVILLSAWALCPVALQLWPSMFGLFDPHTSAYGFLYNLSWMWLMVGGAAVLGRTLYLAVMQTPQTGLVWLVKILTDPFHDIRIYHKAPFYLLRGERYDPMTDNWGPRTVQP